MSFDPEPTLDGTGPPPTPYPTFTADNIPVYPLVAPLASSPFTSPHSASGLATDTCAACHRVHMGRSSMLLSEAPPQSGLCFTCHDGSGSGYDIQAEFSDPTLPANDPANGDWYSHPATVDLGHVAGLIGEFGGVSNRHATCADCHDPHRADGGLAAPGPSGWSASGALIGAPGVSVANGPAGSAPAYTLVGSVTREYQVCLRCHSGYTQLRPPDPGRPSRWALDKGIEINPANGSYHPIAAPGTNQTAAMAASLAGGVVWQFAPGDTIRCTNCHGDPARLGLSTDPAARLVPHTSPERGLLIAAYRDRLLSASGADYDPTDFTLCFLCHSPDPFVDPDSTATNFPLHAKHVSEIKGEGSGGRDIDVAGAGQGNAICAECHFRLHSTALAVKPGDVGNARLVNFAPNVLASSGVLQWQGGPGGSCTLVCHGKDHGAEGY